ncbi:MAG: transcriptional repressor [Alphaproteobacteria bacterium]|nr:transcriptional repressor [Alphaproteobacteria bacterium]
MQAKTKETIAAIERKLTAKGERFTAPRRQVMATLLDYDGTPKAYDIVEAMGDVKPMTVYRALDFLVAQGLAHRIESLNAYAPCVESHCAHKDSQYLICEKCEKVEELHNHAIDDFIAKQLLKDGFKIEAKVIEIHGLCSDCT